MGEQEQAAAAAAAEAVKGGATIAQRPCLGKDQDRQSMSQVLPVSTLPISALDAWHTHTAVDCTVTVLHF